MTRIGYYKIANAIREMTKAPPPGLGEMAPTTGRSRPKRRVEVDGVSRRAWFRRKGAPLGRNPGRALALLHLASPKTIYWKLRRV